MTIFNELMENSNGIIKVGVTIGTLVAANWALIKYSSSTEQEFLNKHENNSPKL